MDKKYYIPSLEEFHKGFEYEQLMSNPQADLEPTWQKCKFPDPFVGWRADKISNARVKYLDRNDIQSFDFTLVGYDFDYEDYRGLNKMKGIRLLFNPKTNKIKLLRYIEKGGYDIIMKFIEIRNKSELQRILKMIEII